MVIALYSFRDLVRQRILYNVFFVSLFLLIFGYLAALLVYGHQDRVMLHFGTLVNSLSIFFVAASAGASSIRSEIDQRTEYLILSRPVSRISYFYGKWIGIILFTALNLFLLNIALMMGLHMTDGRINLAFLESNLLIWCESFLISGLALLLSVFLRPGLSTMICLAYLFLAHNHEQLDYLMVQGSENSGIFKLFKLITPDARILSMDTRVYYDLPLSLLEFGRHFGYGVFWAFFFLLLGNAFFYRKNL